jgi:hypothetical protein
VGQIIKEDWNTKKIIINMEGGNKRREVGIKREGRNTEKRRWE